MAPGATAAAPWFTEMTATGRAAAEVLTFTSEARLAPTNRPPTAKVPSSIAPIEAEIYSTTRFMNSMDQKIVPNAG